jgi:uncharacterized Zn finger protein
MEAPGSLYFQCPECDDYTLHHIIKAKFSTKKKTTLSGTAQCTVCEFVHHVEYKEGSDIEINLIISTGNSSERTKITLPADEELELGMELLHEDSSIMITKLERDERRFRSAKVKHIGTIWAKRFNSLPIKISISHGPRTYSRKVFAAPDEEFEIGDMIRFDEYNAVIKKIKDTSGMVNTGFVKGRDIIRVYCAIVRGR